MLVYDFNIEPEYYWYLLANKITDKKNPPYFHHITLNLRFQDNYVFEKLKIKAKSRERKIESAYLIYILRQPMLVLRAAFKLLT